jgi:DNA-binding Lrp family transcriptional regulator
MDENQNTTQQDTHAAQDKKTIVEEFKVSGEAVVGRVKEIIREGNVRRITIKNEEGKILFEIPLTFGIVGALLLPQLAALGAVGALIAKLSITIEREDDKTIAQPPANVHEGGDHGA